MCYEHKSYFSPSFFFSVSLCPFYRSLVFTRSREHLFRLLLSNFFFSHFCPVLFVSITPFPCEGPRDSRKIKGQGLQRVGIRTDMKLLRHFPMDGRASFDGGYEQTSLIQNIGLSSLHMSCILIHKFKQRYVEMGTRSLFYLQSYP